LFGPSAVFVTASSREQMMRIARELEGHLTATIHGTPADLREFSDLVDVLQQKVGRLIFNGFPTGVEVCPSMQHGGPYPATTDSRTTSVGTAAIERFARPLCWQSFPQEVLPEELRDDNPRGIWRLVDGQLTR
jgi:NADP-dependent aldehyde dehydrogenase